MGEGLIQGYFVQVRPRSNLSGECSDIIVEVPYGQGWVCGSVYPLESSEDV
jgi:hypothetical protein